MLLTFTVVDVTCARDQQLIPRADPSDAVIHFSGASHLLTYTVIARYTQASLTSYRERTKPYNLNLDATVSTTYEPYELHLSSNRN